MRGGPRKYRNQPVVIDGVRFASKAEAVRDGELQLLQRAGEIKDLKRQPRFPLVVAGVKICTYVADWSYQRRTCLDGRHHTFASPPAYGSLVVEDRKGVQTPAFKIKWALAKALHPEIEWRLS